MTKISQLPQDTAPTLTDVIPTIDTETGLNKRTLLSAILSLFKKNSSYQVAFRAYRVNAYTTPSSGQTSGFNCDTVNYSYNNYGDGTPLSSGGYSPSTGLFTAPVNGIYIFTSSFYTENVSTLRAFTVPRGTAFSSTSTNGTATGSRYTDINLASGSVNRIQASAEFYMTAGQTFGFEVWTGAANNIASPDTWFAGHLVLAI